MDHFFLHIESIVSAEPNSVTKTLFLGSLVATSAGLRKHDFSLSRQAAESLYQRIGEWLSDTAGEEPPTQ